MRDASVLGRGFAVATFVPLSRPVFAFVHCQLPSPNQIITSASRIECLDQCMPSFHDKALIDVAFVSNLTGIYGCRRGPEARACSAFSGLVRAMSNRLPRHFAQFAPSPLPTVCNSRSPDWKPLRSAKSGNGGVRVRTTAVIDRARIPVQIDIGFGDAITPAPIRIDYPVLLDSLRRDFAPIRSKLLRQRNSITARGNK